MNGIAAGTALIQVPRWTVEEALSWLPYPCAVPWDDVVLTIPRMDYMDNPIRSIRTLLESVTEEKLLELQQKSLYFTADLDWTAHHPRVLENLLREAYFVPCKAFEEKNPTTQLEESTVFLPPLLEQNWCLKNRAMAREEAQNYVWRHNFLY